MMCRMIAAAMAVILVASLAAAGNYDGQRYDGAAGYDDLLLQDLYKRLSLMTDDGSNYDNAAGGDGLWSDNAPLNGDEDKMTNAAFPTPGSEDEALKARLRDHEYLEHSSLLSEDGLQYVSGGAGEDKQPLTPQGNQPNPQEGKSDEVLPFYCRPPNPCPKGFTAKDGCDEDMPDTEERQKAWIADLQAAGQCTCDEEHSFVCPKDAEDAGKQEEASQLGDVIDSILAGKTNDNNPYWKGDKRLSVVAKKSPRAKRSVGGRPEHQNMLQEGMKHNANPYMRGPSLGTVAKKGNIFHK